MPYATTEVDLDCTISFCRNCDCGGCDADEKVEKPENLLLTIKQRMKVFGKPITE